ncbi:hypothetical protein I4Q36_07365 [Tuanshanicoccus lijuaniae]|uniref:hypothetical protein n=1 Tax=Aerococcaceae bacterium zg-1292 TaxID=2774330 RepID=UPI0019352863|nr:hypothetical protein [Aerococcaceae bacterium zg-1292]QQA36627.1 hypothetical protein I4Q36_07365 [Aerococcaceae bacterium zg-1292]
MLKKYYINAAIFYVIITILFIAVPSIKNNWLSFIEMDEIGANLLRTINYYSSRVGWMGFSGFRATLSCSIAVAFLVSEYFQDNQIELVPFSIKLGLLLLGNSFYGRSGLVISAIVIIIALMFNLSVELIYKTIIIGFIGFIFIFLFSKIPSFNSWFLWAFTPFKNLIEYGSFNNYSVNSLADSYVEFDPSIKTLIFGDGYYTFNNLYYKETDVGFMRLIYFAGIPGMLLCYFTTFFSLYNFKKDSFLLFLLLMVVFVFLELKGEVYYEFVPLGIWYIVSCYLMKRSNLDEV